MFGGDDGQAVLPLYLPVATASRADGSSACCRAPSTTTAVGSRRGSRPTDAGRPRRTQRGALIEAIINNSEDESLLDRYLDGEDIGLEVLVDDLETAVARGTFYPVLPVCAATGLGLAELLEVLSGGVPVPGRARRAGVTRRSYGTDAKAGRVRPGRPLLAEVVRTTVDPYLGRLSILRIFSGTLTPETAVHVSGHGGGDARPPRPRRRRAGRAALLARSARRCGRSSGRSPATSARSAGSGPPRPATRSRPSPRRC